MVCATRMATGSADVCTLGIAPSRSTPATDGVDCARKRCKSVSALDAAAAISSAKGVARKLRPERSNSGRPNHVSSCFICRLTALGVTPLSAAAVTRFPRETTARKVCSVASFIEKNSSVDC